MNRPEPIIRELTKDDSQPFGELIANSPDTGLVKISTRYKIDPYSGHAFTRENSKTIVAEDPETGQLVGSGSVKLKELTWNGEMRRAAFLNALLVHPNHRRKGIATRLAQWRVEYAKEAVGESGLILATIQSNNVGSETVADSWMTHFGKDQFKAVVVKPISGVAPRMDGVSFRPIMPLEYPRFAEGCNRFHADFQLYEPLTAEAIANKAGSSPFDTPIHHFYGAVADSGEILAGIQLSDYSQIMGVVIEEMPLWIQAVNLITRILPPSREMISLATRNVWIAPGAEGVGKRLIQTIRTGFNDPINSIQAFADRANPTLSLFEPGLLTPSSGISLAIRIPDGAFDPAQTYAF